MSFRKSLLADRAPDAGRSSRSDHAVDRRFRRNRRRLGWHATASWVMALLIEAFTAYGLAMCPDILGPVHEFSPILESSRRDGDTEAQ
jgi:hypothetical protein